jgi:hypothetical protein
MALAKKGSSLITIEDVSYRWVVSANDGFMLLVVESADQNGQQLKACFHYHDISEPEHAGVSRIVGQRRSITPRVVREIILTGLTHGWLPSQRGLPAFDLDGDQVVPLEEQDA